jgi:2-dehydro-3-deoxyphosphooctonate aldolase (KDO 8-P synthase)
MEKLMKSTIIAGPCQHECLDESLKIAEHCRYICESYGFDFYFKASFDKANRSHISGKRFSRSLAGWRNDFKVIRKTLNVKTLTDIHEPFQASSVSPVCDVIQIPAFLCRQTDLIKAAVDTGCIVNIKKGQFLAPWDIAGILSKTEGAKEVWITERGTSFGYNNLVVDFTGLQYMLDTYDVPIVFDVTHSVQKPGGQGNSSGGNRDFVPGLARAGSALGIKHFFLEVHHDPDNAPSDGPNMLKLEDFEKVISDIRKYSYD